jgi:hypothetical protein
MGSSIVTIGGLLCAALSCLVICAAVAIWAVTSSKRR